MPSIARPLALLGTLVALGCSDTTAPLSDRGGTFVLRSVDGKAVPFLQYETTTLRQFLVADTMVFDGRHNVTTLTVVRVDEVNTTSSQEHRYGRLAAYRVRGDTVDFEYPCPATAVCSAPPVGWREADGSLLVAYRSGKAWSNVMRYEEVR